jgi:hypothetical protein
MRSSLSKKAKYANAVLGMAFILVCGGAGAQGIVYDDFEGNRYLTYGERSGVLDTLAKNPAPNKVNSSARCALYVRNGSKKFANIKMNLLRRPSNVEAYATYLGVPPKLKLKVYTSAPPGTLVEILLGSRSGNNDYPAGTHSQYQAYTSVSNQWEELEFKFAQIPQGSETGAAQIDQAVLLFNPNSSTSDTYYFDDLVLPPLGEAPASAQSDPGRKDGQDGKDNSQNDTNKSSGTNTKAPERKSKKK